MQSHSFKSGDVSLLQLHISIAQLVPDLEQQLARSAANAPCRGAPMHAATGGAPYPINLGRMPQPCSSAPQATVHQIGHTVLQWTELSTEPLRRTPVAHLVHHMSRPLTWLTVYVHSLKHPLSFLQQDLCICQQKP